MPVGYHFSINLPDTMRLRQISMLLDGRVLIAVEPLPEYCSHGLSPAEFVGTGFSVDAQEAANLACERSFERLAKPLDSLYRAHKPKKEQPKKGLIANPLSKLAELLK